LFLARSKQVERQPLRRFLSNAGQVFQLINEP